MRFQRNCKICRSNFAQALLYRNHIDKLTYVQLIELYKQYGLELNQYNISCHLHRHVEQSDIEELENLKEKWVEQT